MAIVMAAAATGVANTYRQRRLQGWHALRAAAAAALPLALVLAVLLLTRIEALGLREHLVDDPAGTGAYLGHLARIRVSPALVLRVSEILDVPAGFLEWRFRVLHLPWLLPFLVPAALTTLALRRQLPEGSSIAAPFVAAARWCASLPCACGGRGLMHEGEPGREDCAVACTASGSTSGYAYMTHICMASKCCWGHRWRLRAGQRALLPASSPQSSLRNCLPRA